MLVFIVSDDKFLSSLPQEAVSSFKSFKVLKGIDLVRYATSSEDKKKVLMRFLSGKDWWIKNIV